MKEKYVRLSRDDPESTKIYAGHISFTVQELEDEIKADSEIGKKLKSVEKELEEKY